MTNTALTLDTVTYGEYSFNPMTVPAVSVAALLARGFAHYIGNEQSSKVVSYFRQKAVAEAIAANDGKPLDKETRASIEKSVKLDPESDEYREVKAKFQAEALAAILAGTIGEARGGGPRLDPLAVEMLNITKSEVIAKLVAHGMHKGRKNPVGADLFQFGEVTISFDELLARHAEKNNARIHKEAQAKLDVVARKAKRAAEDAAKLADTPKTLEALDF